jgi:hypothetical protein
MRAAARPRRYQRRGSLAASEVDPQGAARAAAPHGEASNSRIIYRPPASWASTHS